MSLAWQGPSDAGPKFRRVCSGVTLLWPTCVKGCANVYVMETGRLRLRRLTMDDLDHLLLIFSDPVAMQYYPSTMDRAEAAAWIRRTDANYEAYGTGFLAVESREDGRFLGQCGLIPQTIDASVDMEVAYLFVRRFWGQGYATEAARACRDWGFEHLGVSRLVSIISKYNTPSMKVAQRNGMAIVSETVKSGGIPHWVYAISREDWLERGTGLQREP